MLEIYTDTKHPDPKVRELFAEAAKAREIEGRAAEARDLYSRAAAEGCVEAMVNLGAIYAEGAQSEKEKALALFMRAVEAEDPVGMRNVGYLHALGIGVPKDKKLAAEWYERAALKGNARAQCNLGVLYAYGNGVPQNYEKAAYWYMRSAENGYSRAQTNLGVLLVQGKGIEKDHLAAAYWFARSQSPRALYNLALLYQEGDGVPPNPDEARRLIESSASLGYSKAMVALARMLEDTDLGRAKELYARAAKWSPEARKRLAELG